MKYLTFILIMMTSCSLLKQYPNDNIFEEMIEGIIKKETGVDIDLTPNSKEPEKNYENRAFSDIAYVDCV